MTPFVVSILATLCLAVLIAVIAALRIAIRHRKQVQMIHLVAKDEIQTPSFEYNGTTHIRAETIADAWVVSGSPEEADFRHRYGQADDERQSNWESITRYISDAERIWTDDPKLIA
jgi:hypothetical protein